MEIIILISISKVYLRCHKGWLQICFMPVWQSSDHWGKIEHVQKD